MSRTTALQSTSRAPARFPVSAMILYGIGEISITISMVLFGLFILFFYNSVMGLPGVLVGIGSAVGLLWDAIIDPYIGHRSDQSQSRLGRRHSYMLFGACTMGLSFWLLLSPPRDLSVAYLFLWLLVTTLLFRTSSAIYRIPYLSLGAEFSSDYHERTVIVGVRSFFGLIGTLLAASLSFVLFFPDLTPGVDPKMNYAGYPQMGLGFGLVMSVAAFVTILGTMKYRGAARPYTNKSASRHRFFHGFIAALNNRSFRFAWTSYSLFLLAVVLTAVTSVHYYNWYAKLSDSSTISRIQACFYLGALAGVFLWVRLSKRYDKHNLYLASILFTATLLFGAYFLIGEGTLFGVGNATPLYVGNALGGIFASAVWVLPSSMLADISDEDELSTGLRREGVFFGIFNLGEKIAAGISVLVGGLLVQHFVGLVPGTFEQSVLTQQRLGIVYGVVPAILLIGAAVLVRGYRLDRKSLEKIQATLSQGP